LFIPVRAMGACHGPAPFPGFLIAEAGIAGGPDWFLYFGNGGIAYGIAFLSVQTGPQGGREQRAGKKN